MSEPIETLVITRDEYEQLQKDSMWLRHLEAAGVDNWEGYSIAQDMAREDA